MKIKYLFLGDRQDEMILQEKGEECILEPKAVKLSEGSVDDLAKMAFTDPS